MNGTQNTRLRQASRLTLSSARQVRAELAFGADTAVTWHLSVEKPTTTGPGEPENIGVVLMIDGTRVVLAARHGWGAPIGLLTLTELRALSAGLARAVRELTARPAA